MKRKQLLSVALVSMLAVPTMQIKAMDDLSSQDKIIYTALALLGVDFLYRRGSDAYRYLTNTAASGKVEDIVSWLENQATGAASKLKGLEKFTGDLEKARKEIAAHLAEHGGSLKNLQDSYANFKGSVETETAGMRQNLDNHITDIGNHLEKEFSDVSATLQKGLTEAQANFKASLADVGGQIGAINSVLAGLKSRLKTEEGGTNDQLARINAIEMSIASLQAQLEHAMTDLLGVNPDEVRLSSGKTLGDLQAQVNANTETLASLTNSQSVPVEGA